MSLSFSNFFTGVIVLIRSNSRFIDGVLFFVISLGLICSMDSVCSLGKILPEILMYVCFKL